MTPTSRRTFLASATAASLAWSRLPVLGAESRKYRVALIGSGWWGMNLLREAMASGRAKVVALCDADANVLENGIADVEADSGETPKGYKDYRELLAEAKPEIVIIATPDHWHALQTIAACKAGACTAPGRAWRPAPATRAATSPSPPTTAPCSPAWPRSTWA